MCMRQNQTNIDLQYNLDEKEKIEEKLAKLALTKDLHSLPVRLFQYEKNTVSVIMLCCFEFLKHQRIVWMVGLMMRYQCELHPTERTTHIDDRT